jgi:NitT/TauT family transport system permease protein
MRHSRLFGTRVLDSLLLVAAGIIVWQGLFAVVGSVAITPPIATIRYAGSLLTSDLFWNNLQATLRALGYSVAISWVLGVAIGTALGFNKFSGEVAEPIISSFYTIPKVTLYPLILLIFGLELSAKVAFGVIHGIIPVIIFTMSAVRTIAPVHLKTARVLNLTPFQTAWTILLPAVVPEVFTGLRIGFSLCMLGVIVGEMFASQRGLGFAIMNAMNTYNIRDMTALILLLVIFALLSNTILLIIDRRLHR